MAIIVRRDKENKKKKKQKKKKKEEKKKIKPEAFRRFPGMANINLLASPFD